MAISIPQRCDYFRSPAPFRARRARFQYHKGAIISDSEPFRRDTSTMISIPQRCDYFRSSGLMDEFGFQISIPQRCDYFPAMFDGNKWLIRISIPQRCDYFCRRAGHAFPRARISIPQRCDYFLAADGLFAAFEQHFNTTKVRLFPDITFAFVKSK